MPWRVAEDVEAEAGAAAAIRRKQAAQHADRGRLAAAVGAEKAADLAASRPQRQALDDLARAVTLAQIVDVDHEFVSWRRGRAGCTVTG